MTKHRRFAALALAVIPSLLDGQWGTWVPRALNFLVVSCPCALVISIPLSFFGGLGGASEAGHFSERKQLPGGPGPGGGTMW